MLPAPKSHAPSLADVMESGLRAISGEQNALALPAVDSTVVVLIDGLGADVLKQRSGHARTLAATLGPKSVIETVFPSTTAAALASLTTGTLPGQHGLVGYATLDPAHDRVVNQLTGWDALIDPLTWQGMPTLFETAAAAGIDPVVVAHERYRDSGFTRAVLRGARFVDEASVADRMTRAATEVSRPGRHLVYVYVPELDQAAHAHGVESAEWIRALETVDAAVRDLVSQLGRRDGLLVTADHGILDIPEHAHVVVEGALLEGVRHLAGEPRCLQLHLEPGADAAAVLARWRESEGERAWVVTRDEAIAAGWFGEVRPEVLPRIGDILVAARKAIAYYADENGHGRSMVGQHGSWSPAERRVPLLRYGAFAR